MEVGFGRLKAMRTLATLIVVVTLVLASLQAGCEKPEVAAVREADRQNDAAIDSRDGEAAAKFLSKAYVAWLDEAMERARTLGRDDLRKLRPSDMHEVLVIRARLTPAQMKSFDGRAWYAHQVKQGWSESTTSMGYIRGRIAVSGSKATIRFKMDGEWVDDRCVYLLEDGEWKEDRTATWQDFDRAALELNRDEGRPMHETIFELVEDEIGSKVSDSVWSAPRL